MGREYRGPRVVPGMYQVRLTVDGKTMTESFEVVPDPRITTVRPTLRNNSSLA